MKLEAVIRTSLQAGKGLPTTLVKGNASECLRDVLMKTLYDVWPNHKSFETFYKSNVQALNKDSIAGLMVSDVTNNHLNDWVQENLLKGSARSTINQKLGVIRVALERAQKVYGMEVQGIEWKDIRLKKASHEHKIWFTDEVEEQIHTYLKGLGRQDIIDLFIILADVGARFGSIIRLKQQDIDLEKRTIKLVDTKNGTDIILPLTRRAVDVLALRVAKPEPFADLNYSTVRQVWDRMRKEFGWPSGEGYKIHALRHTCGTKLAKAGVDIRVIQQWLGHKDIRQTARYTQVLPEQLEAAMHKLEKSSNPDLT